MTKDERMRAFALRCEGATWEEIGEILHYTGNAVCQDIHRIVDRKPSLPKIVYPNIYKAMCKNYGGSISQLADAMHVSPHRLRRVLLGDDAPTENLKAKLCRELHMEESEVFMQ